MCLCLSPFRPVFPLRAFPAEVSPQMGFSTGHTALVHDASNSNIDLTVRPGPKPQMRGVLRTHSLTHSLTDKSGRKV